MPDQTIRLSRATDARALATAVALLLDGGLDGHSVLASQHVVTVAGADRLVVRERHPGQAERLATYLSPLHTLVAGLHRCGFGVTVEGDFASLLPGAGTLPQPSEPPPPAPAYRRIFEDHLPAEVRTPPVVWAALDGADPDQLRHLVPSSARLPLSSGEAPLPARTWGEIAVNHGWFAGTPTLAGLEVLTDEVALVAADTVHRYTVDDLGTLEHRDRLTFGPGRSRLLSPESWLDIAARAGEQGHHALAADCCAQAGAAGREEEAHWRAWVDWVAAEVAPGPPVDVRLAGFDDLVAAVGERYATGLAGVAQVLLRAAADAEDHHVPAERVPVDPFDGDGVRLEAPLVTGHDLVSAGVSPQALARLGFHADPVPLPARYPSILTVRCGDEVLWGTVGSGRLLRRADPGVVYRLRRG